jgi:mRNA-degrading endonuclease toxin of MazEF toxin-antitoxin module
VVVITTTEPSKAYRFMVEIPKSANMPERSWIHCGQIRTVDKEKRLGRYYTSLDVDTVRKVGESVASLSPAALTGTSFATLPRRCSLPNTACVFSSPYP